MLIAGEASGDMLAAELVEEIKTQTRQLPWPIEFFGAGGPRMKSAGVELRFDMTEHAVIGLWEAVMQYGKFRRLFNDLLTETIRRQPDIIICVDFGGFNRRFAKAVREHRRYRNSPLAGWNPRIVQYVSPQVWASRPGRARLMAKDLDLLLCLLPFEKNWWAKHVPGFPVEFVGHPTVGRRPVRNGECGVRNGSRPLVALLPGSRKGELKSHLPVVVATAKRIRQSMEVEFAMILPNESAAEFAMPYVREIPDCRVSVGNQAEVLSQSTVALSKTGTITLELAVAGVPSIAFYKTSWLTYQVGRRLVSVPYLSMPNLLANEPVFPEFVQDDASPENLASAILDLLNDEDKRTATKVRLAEIVSQLGPPGAPERAAQAILHLHHP